MFTDKWNVMPGNKPPKYNPYNTYRKKETVHTVFCV